MFLDPLAFAQFGLAGLTLGVIVYVIRLLLQSQEKNNELLAKVNERTATALEKNTEAFEKFSTKLDESIRVQEKRYIDFFRNSNSNNNSSSN